MATRKEVYAAIDSERDYQDARWVSGGAQGGGASDHEIDAFLLYMDVYLDRAKLLGATTASTTGADARLDAIRKVIGLGVACMEKHGAPKRGDLEGGQISRP